jgi:hypothetical protein
MKFVIKEELSEQTKALLMKMKNKCTISVHVRRGDYIENFEYNNFFGSYGEEYYIKACESARFLGSAPFWIFFSDDIKWVRSALLPSLLKRRVIDNYEVVDWTGARRAFEDKDNGQEPITSIMGILPTDYFFGTLCR